MKTVCIVQARMGSTRLPGKVLLPLNGHTVIGEVLTRCKRIASVDSVVCAIPDSTENDALEREARSHGFAVVRGSEQNVLERYWWAATCHGADIVVRVTGDCPLISPELCAEVVAKLKKHQADYASNIEPRTFPQGMDCEAFTFKLLRMVNETAKPHEREHVTTMMREAPAAFVRRVNVESPWKLEGRLTLDTEDDYKVICAAFGHEPYQRLQAA